MPDALVGALNRIRDGPASLGVEAAQHRLCEAAPEAGPGNEEPLQIFDLVRGEPGGDRPWSSEPMPDQV